MGTVTWSPITSVSFLEDAVRMALTAAAAASDHFDRLERHMRRLVVRMAARLGASRLDSNSCTGYAWAVYAARREDRIQATQLRKDWGTAMRRLIRWRLEVSELIEDLHAARSLLAQIRNG